jgi:hypothetical protein
MLASLRSVKFSVLWRTISIICVMMVFSYIFFEVLDLDGSNFPLQRYPVESTAIVPETETNTIRPYLTQLAEPRTEFSFSWLTKHVDWVYLRLIETLTAPGSTQVPRRGYRASLPRSSIPDL